MQSDNQTVYLHDNIGFSNNVKKVVWTGGLNTAERVLW